MDSKICHAIQDINTIKETIEDAKVHYRGMYLLCFLMGTYNILRLLLSMAFLIHPSWTICVSICTYLLPLLLFVGYIYIYRNEKKYSNKYYLSLLGIWGVVAIAIPMGVVVVSIIDFLRVARDSAPSDNSNILYAFYSSYFSSILLFAILMIVCAYSLNKRYLVWFSIAVLFGYMVLVSCFGNESIPFPFLPGQKEAGMAYHSVYYNAVACIGYMVLGFYIRYKNRKEAVG